MLRGLRSDRICDAAAQHPGCAQGSDFGALCQRALAGCKGVGEDVRSFRIGLFGLDKLMHVDRTVENLDRALSALL